MKLSVTLLAAALAYAHAFGVAPPSTARNSAACLQTTPLRMAVDTIYEGKPTERALNLDIREEIRKSSFFDVEGNTVTMDKLIGEPSQSGVSVVVLLRSLG
jgi:hypothetical protein